MYTRHRFRRMSVRPAIEPLCSSASAGPVIASVIEPARAPQERERSFRLHPGGRPRECDGEGVRLRVLAGTAFGMTSPVETVSALFYVEARMAAGSTFSIPIGPEERAVYVVEGVV